VLQKKCNYIISKNFATGNIIKTGKTVYVSSDNVYFFYYGYTILTIKSIHTLLFNASRSKIGAGPPSVFWFPQYAV
jgi:hypothetical protein